MYAKNSSSLAGIDPACLSDHLRQCTYASGPWHRLECATEAVNGFLGRRFITTLAAIALLVSFSVWLPI